MRRDGVRRWLRWSLSGAGVVGFAAVAQAIVVAPHAVFMGDGQRSAVIYLYNASDQPEEVSISFVFGYPASDSAGNIRMHFVEEPDPLAPSAAGWIRAFPRRVRVEPRQRQAVRLLAQPPSELPDGEYWTRLVVTSRAAQPPIAAPDTGVRAGLILEVRTVISVSYRKGSLSTGVAVTDLDAAVEGDSLIVRVGMRRKRTAAYLGTLGLVLRDSAGAAKAEWERPIAVYYDLVRRVALPVTDLPRGSYSLDVRLGTTRSDIPMEHVIQSEAVHRRVEFQLP